MPREYTKSCNESSFVCVIGTNSDVYCSYLEISSDYYYSMLENLFKHIKQMNCHSKVIYYAHGRDNNNKIRALCAKNEVFYILPATMVELSIIENEKIPSAIWGFTSSALYNLKKIYPNTNVYNVRIQYRVRNKEIDEYDFLSEYYEKNDIYTMFLPLDD